MAIRYTNKELTTFLKQQIIDSILLENGFGAIPSIRSHENAPAPGTHYIVIQYTGIKSTIGRVSKTDLLLPVDALPDDLPTRYVVNDIRVPFDISEVGGDGDLLDLIKDSLELEKYLEILAKNKIAIMEIGNIVPAPYLFNDDYTKRSDMELILGTISGFTEEVNYIEEVQYSGNI